MPDTCPQSMKAEEPEKADEESFAEWGFNNGVQLTIIMALDTENQTSNKECIAVTLTY